GDAQPRADPDVTSGWAAIAGAHRRTGLRDRAAGLLRAASPGGGLEDPARTIGDAWRRRGQPRRRTRARCAESDGRQPRWLRPRPGRTSRRPGVCYRYSDVEGSSLSGIPVSTTPGVRGRSESHSWQDFYAEFRMEVMIMKDRVPRWFSSFPSWVRRLIVFVIGSTILIAGLLMLVLPGPGILVIIVGLAILATEFVWAERLLIRARERVARVAQKLRKPKNDPG